MPVLSKNLETLVSVAKLTEIIAFELSVKRIELLSSEPIEIPKQFLVQPNYNLKTLASPDGTGFLIRLAVEVSVPIGQLRCEVGAAYKLAAEVDFEITPNMLIEYSNEVAIMTLLPFLRQHVADLSQRALGFPLIMPIMDRGALKFSLNE